MYIDVSFRSELKKEERKKKNMHTKRTAKKWLEPVSPRVTNSSPVYVISKSSSFMIADVSAGLSTDERRRARMNISSPHPPFGLRKTHTHTHTNLTKKKSNPKRKWRMLTKTHTHNRWDEKTGYDWAHAQPFSFLEFRLSFFFYLSLLYRDFFFALPYLSQVVFLKVFLLLGERLYRHLRAEPNLASHGGELKLRFFFFQLSTFNDMQQVKKKKTNFFLVI